MGSCQSCYLDYGANQITGSRSENLGLVAVNFCGVKTKQKNRWTVSDNIFDFSIDLKAELLLNAPADHELSKKQFYKLIL